MGAYYQNQVVIEEESELHARTTVFSPSGIKFLESQYADEDSTKNIIRYLSRITNENNTAKVYCVCDYDESENGEYCQEYLYKGEPLTALTAQACDADGKVIPNATYIPSLSEFTKNLVLYSNPVVSGYDSGYIVNKDKNEYIDVELMNAVSYALNKEYQAYLISPLSMLTRKNKEGMGGGDIRFDDLFSEDIESIASRWYNDNLYWTEQEPNDSVEMQNITSYSLFVETSYTVPLADKEKTEGNTSYSVLPLFSKYSPYKTLKI